VRGDPGAFGTAVVTMPARTIHFIRRRGLRLSGRYPTQTRAGSSYRPIGRVASEIGTNRPPVISLVRSLSGACKELPTGAIATGMFFPRGVPSAGLRMACPTSGGTHEQICDPAFDTGDIRNRAGAGSDGHTGGDRDQQQAYQEASKTKAPWLQRAPRCGSAVACYQACQSVRPGLPGQRPKFRLSGVAASLR